MIRRYVERRPHRFMPNRWGVCRYCGQNPGAPIHDNSVR